MSSILQIKERFSTYTEGEERIANYIINNQETVIKESAQIVAKKTETSPSTVVRFSKRLGYSGFTDLKLKLAQDLKNPVFESLDEIIQESDSFETMIHKAQHANSVTFSKVYQLINTKKMEEAVEILSSSRKIHLIGLGGSSIICQDLYHKLTRINIDCVYNQDFHMLLTSLAHINESDCTIVFSYSGETSEAILAQKYAKSKGARTIAVTSNYKSSISRYTDCMLLIPQEEKELRLGAISSRFSFLAISDLLYFGIAKKNLNDVSSQLKDTRELLKKLSR